MTFTYQCPECGTTNRLHDFGCEYEGVDIREFEKCYIDIISTLLMRKTTKENAAGGDALPCDWNWMTDNVPDGWTSKHTACFHTLKRRGLVREADSGEIALLHPDEREKASQPSAGDIELVYEYGACNGCLDYGTSAMVSWCEMQGYSWDETVEFVVDWLHESGTWERGDFEEATPEDLVGKKQHIHDNGVGWGRFATNTVHKMADQGLIPDESLPDDLQYSHGGD